MKFGTVKGWNLFDKIWIGSFIVIIYISRFVFVVEHSWKVILIFTVPFFMTFLFRPRQEMVEDQYNVMNVILLGVGLFLFSFCIHSNSWWVALLSIGLMGVVYIVSQLKVVKRYEEKSKRISAFFGIMIFTIIGMSSQSVVEKVDLAIKLKAEGPWIEFVDIGDRHYENEKNETPSITAFQQELENAHTPFMGTVVILKNYEGKNTSYPLDNTFAKKVTFKSTDGSEKEYKIWVVWANKFNDPDLASKGKAYGFVQRKGDAQIYTFSGKYAADVLQEDFSGGSRE